ncbi:MAG: hypothetical protein Q7R56_01540 [Nanoarchaeota archaeon]|nr:hypothetical protein [Nanoarchaeota archaeon]
MLPTAEQALRTSLEGRLTTAGLLTPTTKPTLEQAEEHVYQSVVEIIDQYGPQFGNDLKIIQEYITMGRFRDFLYRRLEGLGKKLNLTSLGEVLHDFYREHEFKHPINNGKENERRRELSLLFYTSEVELEQYIEKHTRISKRRNGKLVVRWSEEELPFKLDEAA